MFEAFNISSEHWDGRTKWAAISIDGMFIIEGSVNEDRTLNVNGIVESKSNVNIGLRSSCRHIICQTIDGEKTFDFAHYRASQITVEHTKLSFLLYTHASGKKWAIAENHTKVVVLFKNDQTQGRWVLYENEHIDLTNQDGISERIKVIKSKLNKGYNLDGLCTYEGIIKQ
ncbi:hypothetical protein H5202_21710 [Shewanella sp. SG41-4]|uniref:hypothetical protein n=1 Tax=Shewanella sp. SG41-4 TaxID=2760976 RepID=UPI0016015F04|nr:hypothetical protein [Shewanella sp. SG41-4]MBB1441199.1 hypothetical protein [Shewanella sp. SG41-4]